MPLGTGGGPGPCKTHGETVCRRRRATATGLFDSQQQAGDQEDTGEVDTVLTGILQDPSASVPWPHVRLMVRGSGAAGKTATINSMAGKPFESTSSTVGANTCDIELSACDVSLRDSQGHFEPHRLGGDICNLATAAYAASLLKETRDLAEQPSILDSMREGLEATIPREGGTCRDSSRKREPLLEMVFKFDRGEL